MPDREVYDWVLGMKDDREACEYFGVSRTAWQARVKQVCEETELGDELRQCFLQEQITRVAQVKVSDATAATSPSPRVQWKKVGFIWRKVYEYPASQAE